MNRRVPYLSERFIERDAELLLGEFMLARHVRMEPPIPIEDIVEKHLKLGIEFDDLHRRFGIPRSEDSPEPDILGAIYFESGRIVVDESLDPEEHPEIEGRYRFTLAHEAGGHWRLHRHLFDPNPDQRSFLTVPTPSFPSVLCRSSKAKEPIEWQADFYASCLLMPKPMVLAAWRERFGDGNPRLLKRRNRIPLPENASPMIRSVFEGISRQMDEELIRDLVRPFAQEFQVSLTAMRIRLEKLGLLLREEPRQQSLAVGQ
jgi:Zn-dependent peptidase ImmA (M78 family)